MLRTSIKKDQNLLGKISKDIRNTQMSFWNKIMKWFNLIYFLAFTSNPRIIIQEMTIKVTETIDKTIKLIKITIISPVKSCQNQA